MHRGRRRTAVRIVATVALLAMGGCAEADGPAGNSTQAADSSAAESAAPPGASDASASNGPVLSPSGIGPVSFGMSTAEAGEALGAPLMPPNARCQESSAMPGVEFVVHAGTVAAAGTYTPSLPVAQLVTDTGISMESTREQLLAAYPSDLATRPSSGDAYTTFYTWTAPNGRVFQFSLGDQMYSLFAGDSDVAGFEELCAG
jgi:hypothetical protein